MSEQRREDGVEHLRELIDRQPDVMTPQQVADVLQMSTKGVYRWLKEGILPGHKIGSSWFILAADLYEALQDGSNRR